MFRIRLPRFIVLAFGLLSFCVLLYGLAIFILFTSAIVKQKQCDAVVPISVNSSWQPQSIRHNQLEDFFDLVENQVWINDALVRPAITDVRAQYRCQKTCRLERFAYQLIISSRNCTDWFAVHQSRAFNSYINVEFDIMQKSVTANTQIQSFYSYQGANLAPTLTTYWPRIVEKAQASYSASPHTAERCLVDPSYRLTISADTFDIQFVFQSACGISTMTLNYDDLFIVPPHKS